MIYQETMMLFKDFSCNLIREYNILPDFNNKEYKEDKQPVNRAQGGN